MGRSPRSKQGRQRMMPMWMIQQLQSQELERAGVRYAWVVTHEYESDWDARKNDYVGRWVKLDDPVAGPSTATEEEIERAAHKGRTFRIDYDGQDGPCCRGKIWMSDAKHPTGSDAVWAPLDDYG